MTRVDEDAVAAVLAQIEDLPVRGRAMVLAAAYRPIRAAAAKHRLACRAIRQQLLAEWSRGQLIAWLTWNDANGRYRDEDAAREGDPPLSYDEALSLVMACVEDWDEPQHPFQMRLQSRRP